MSLLRFLHRSPVRPPLAFLNLLMVGVGLLGGYNMLMGITSAVIPFQHAFSWVLLTWVASLLVHLTWPTLDFLRRRSPQPVPAWQEWVHFLGTLTGMCLLAGLLRSAFAFLAWPRDMGPIPFWALAFNLALSLLLITVLLERMADYVQDQWDWAMACEQVVAKLTRSRQEIVALDDRMRQDLAELLHGEFQGRLLMAWSALDRGQHPPSEDLPAYLDAARDQITCLREIGLPKARSLLSSQDSEPNLVAALGQLTERFQPVLRTSLEVDGQAHRTLNSLDPWACLSLVRMVEEALNNTFRHARARQSRVRLSVTADGRWLVTVRDDGMGFDPQTTVRGLGLSGLGQALAAHGGGWDLVSSPGGGTTVRAWLPIGSRIPDGVR